MLRAWSARAIAGAAAVFTAAVCVSARPGSQAPDPRPPVAGPNTASQTLPPSPQSQEYVGSKECARCHQEQYETWHNTLHVQMTKPIGEARVVGDFQPGTHLEAYGRAYKMETHDGRYFISVSRNGNPPEQFEVNYTLGARRFQGYLSKLPDGRIYVLPVFWHQETRRWIDWKEITPIPNDPNHDLRQIWNVTCVNCHATNLAKRYDLATNTYNSTWTEMGIGCEACHGPGRPHIALMDEWEKNPASKPKYDNSAGNRELSGILKIFSPRTASPRQVFDTCGYCHGNKNNVFFGFAPGARYEDFALPFLISQPIPDNDPQGDYWTDGRPNRFNRPQAITMTGCFQRGEITCTKCHSAHSSRNDHMLKVAVMNNGKTTRQSDALCTQCHTAGSERGAAPAAGETSRQDATSYGSVAVTPAAIPDLSAHTHHAPGSAGSRCIECHMSDVNWRLFTRRRDHTFQPPVPEMTETFGVANACNTCHEDKSPEWAAARMDEWYGNKARRRATVAMAETFYRAGAGDVAVLDDVVKYAVDRSRGALVRASAAEFAAQLLAKLAAASDPRSSSPRSPSLIVNALLGAASDPEPMVRIAAVRALGLTRDVKTAPALVARLRDDARVVRAAAAESLLDLGFSHLDGPAGAALTRAQDDWRASLRTFPDVAADHTALGWLDSEVGNTENATKELDIAIRLDPKSPLPHVYLGVIAARAGQYPDALRHFKAAQSLDPSFANLDRLIEEARKRTVVGG